MPPSRRHFLSLTAAAGSLAAFGCSPSRPAPSAPSSAGSSRARAPDPGRPGGPARPAGKTLLILGGTSFLGPALVEAAKARGYTITLFNRGKTRPHLFPDIEKLHGDRDPSKGDGLKALSGRSWDAVIDNSGFVPRIVKASAELLAPNVKQYVFISSLSVYASHTTPSADETAPVGTLSDPTVETMGKEYENYGPLKALCEQAAEAAMPGRVTNVRPGFIVGPEDPTDRFTYWPVRVDRGGDVLAPGAPSDPIQIIDVRDLAAWLIQVVETRTTGVFNAAGPGEPLTMGGLLDACAAASNARATFTWVSAQFIEKLGGEPVDLPIWAPAEGETRAFHLRSAERARKAGLTFRPVSETVKDTLAWWKTLPADRQAKLRAGLTPEREAEVLAAWRARGKKAGPP
ncbi:NAD-dependent epimerase/dehydratase family protein [Sorangium sp. So ce131]|uniref:NAD-dependent epimerase/dehydratase family protein n=1 Tax=Sorangium sp. So ce131 TaxID=3133282 RepID=UPI003F5FECAA